jgi:hypothetical protein
MSRGSPFRQVDVTRALRAAKAAGLDVSAVEIDPATGRIVIRTVHPAGEKICETELDKWLEKHGAH